MNLKSILVVPTLGAVALASAQAVPGGSLIVERVGDGSAALSSAATAIFLDNYSTAGKLGTSYAVPAGSTGGLTNSGTATSEGTLTLSGNTVGFVGYRAAAGTQGGTAVGGSGTSTSITNSASASVNRVVGTLNLSTGAINTGTAITDSFSTNNIRGAYVTGNTYYAVGANTGLVSGTIGSSADTVLNTTSVNNRYVQGFGGNVYFSSGSTTGGGTGIYQYVAGATGNESLILNTGTTGPTISGTTTTSNSPYDFQFLSATSLLVADSNTGISLYTSPTGAAGTFTLASTLANSVSSAFAVSGGNIYFTTYAGSSTATTTLDVASLNGTTFGTASVLATAGANEQFRGVVFVPVQATPEPSAFAALGVGALALLRRRRKA